jgi:hypothetical protein
MKWSEYAFVEPFWFLMIYYVKPIIEFLRSLFSFKLHASCLLVEMSHAGI